MMVLEKALLKERESASIWDISMYHVSLYLSLLPGALKIKRSETARSEIKGCSWQYQRDSTLPLDLPYIVPGKGK